MDGMGEEGEGIHLHSRKLLAFSLCISEGDIGIVRSRSFVGLGHSSPFSTLFIGAKKTHSTLSLPSFDSFTAAMATPRQSISVWERERERGLVTQFSFSPSLPLPHPASALSNTMQHPPIHRCFSHPHIALLDQSTTERHIRQAHLIAFRVGRI